VTDANASVVGVATWRVERVAETGSTNADLLAAARAGEPAGAVLVADRQSAGRGRLGRQWQAPPGSSLLMSVLLRPAVSVTRLHRLTQAMGVAAAAGCGQVAGVRADLKWPNDLLVGDRKLAGILAEAVTGPSGAVDAVVVGMGLNVHWPTTEDAVGELAGRVVCLDEAAGRHIDRDQLLDAVLAGLAAIDDDTLDREYRARLATLGREVRVELPNEVFTGTAVDVDPDGQLVVQVDGVPRRVGAGDVVHLR